MIPDQDGVEVIGQICSKVEEEEEGNEMHTTPITVANTSTTDVNDEKDRNTLGNHEGKI